MHFEMHFEMLCLKTNHYVLHQIGHSPLTSEHMEDTPYSTSNINTVSHGEPIKLTLACEATIHLVLFIFLHQLECLWKEVIINT